MAKPSVAHTALEGLQVRAPSWRVVEGDSSSARVARMARPLVSGKRVLSSSSVFGTVALDVESGQRKWHRRRSVRSLIRRGDTAVDLVMMCSVYDPDCRTSVVAVDIGSGLELGTRTEGWLQPQHHRLVVDENSGDLVAVQSTTARTLGAIPRSICGSLRSWYGYTLHLLPLDEGSVIVRTPVEIARFVAGERCAESQPPTWRVELEHQFLPGTAVFVAKDAASPRVAMVQNQELRLISIDNGEQQVVPGRFAGCAHCLVTRADGALWGLRYTTEGIVASQITIPKDGEATTATPEVAVPGSYVLDATAFLGGIAIAVQLDTSMFSAAVVFIDDGKVAWVWPLPRPVLGRSQPVHLAAGASGLVVFFDGHELAFWKSSSDE